MNSIEKATIPSGTFWVESVSLVCPIFLPFFLPACFLCLFLFLFLYSSFVLRYLIFHHNNSSFFFRQDLEPSSLKPACSRQTSTSVNIPSSRSKFTSVKASSCKSEYRQMQLVYRCFLITAGLRPHRIPMIHRFTP